jgi:hypothetical protein
MLQRMATLHGGHFVAKKFGSRSLKLLGRRIHKRNLTDQLNFAIELA